MGIIRVTLIQKHVSLIEKKQSVLVMGKLKVKQKLLFELYCIITQIPSRYLQILAQREALLKATPTV